MAHNVVTKTPHAAVIVWNYKDRLGSDTTSANVNDVESKIISTVSIMSITTSKSKSSPVGRFEVILAPTCNWVSSLTAGSWICIMISNEKIEKTDFDKANKKKVKLFGRIESVRQSLTVNQETGARQTTYSVSGTDWCTVFENKMYIDPYIDPANQTLGNASIVEILKLSSTGGTGPYRQMMIDIISIMGKPFENLASLGNSVNRVAKGAYDFELPDKVASYFNFAIDSGNRVGGNNTSRKLTELLNLYTGVLRAEDQYSNDSEAVGIFNFHAFLGTDSMWQILMEHSNPTLNEMVADLRWGSASDPKRY